MKAKVKIDGVNIFPSMIGVIEKWNVEHEMNDVDIHISSIQKANDFLLNYLIAGGSDKDSENTEILHTLMGLQQLKTDLKEFSNINAEE